MKKLASISSMMIFTALLTGCVVSPYDDGRGYSSNNGRYDRPNYDRDHGGWNQDRPNWNNGKPQPGPKPGHYPENSRPAWNKPSANHKPNATPPRPHQQKPQHQQNDRAKPKQDHRSNEARKKQMLEQQRQQRQNAPKPAMMRPHV